MISDALLSRENLEFDEYAQTPAPEHLVPDSVEREQEQLQFQSKLDDDPDAIVISHTDADGLSSAALLVDYLERTLDTTEIVVKTIDYHGAYRFEHVVEDFCAITCETPIYISDFALDTPDVIQQLEFLVEHRDCSITWYDHHQWDDGTLADLEDAGVDVVIDEDECAASLIARELGPYDDRLEDLAECTKDIDLWIREDPRSERLNVFAAMVDDPEDYIYTALECGADLPEDIEQRIDERLGRQRELEEYAIENRSVSKIGDYTVAITYVRGGRSSQIGNDLVEKMDHDIAVILKPHGGVGIYSHSNRETFARCHEVADQLGGGGHPTAAGCEIPASTFRQLSAYWMTRGRSVYTDILNAIGVVVGTDERYVEGDVTVEQALEDDVEEAVSLSYEERDGDE